MLHTATQIRSGILGSPYGIQVSGVLQHLGVLSVALVLNCGIKQVSKYLKGTEEGEVVTERKSCLIISYVLVYWVRNLSMNGSTILRETKIFRGNSLK